MVKKFKYNSPQQWQFWIERERINPNTNKIFTEKEAKIHVSSFRKNSKYYWMKRGYSEDESIKLVFDNQSKSSKQCIEKYTNDKSRNTTQIGFWMKRGYSEDEAKVIVSERQKTFTLDKCVKKYGIDEGLKVHTERQLKWQKTLNDRGDQDFNLMKSLSLETFLEKGFDLDYYCHIRITKQKSDPYIITKTKKFLIDNNIKLTNDNFNSYYKIFLRKLKECRGEASYESLKYFIPLYKFCRRELQLSKDDIMFGISGSKEFCIIKDQTKKSRRYKYDFTILSKKIIIEYNHLDFHPHPDHMNDELFESFRVPLSKEKAIEKYKYDIKKQREAEKNGYKVYILWSHLNFEEQLQNIKRILREKDSL